MDFKARYESYHEIWSRRKKVEDESSLRNLGRYESLDGLTREEFIEHMWREGSVIVPPLLWNDGVLRPPILAYEGYYAEYGSLQIVHCPTFDELALQEWHFLAARSVALEEALEGTTLPPVVREAIVAAIAEIEARMWTLSTAIPTKKEPRTES